MRNKFELKKYYLWDNFKFRPHLFLMYWNHSTIFPNIFLGIASYRFKNEQDGKDSQNRIWDFTFTDTTPTYIKNLIITSSKTEEGYLSPKNLIPSLILNSISDFHEEISSRISPGNDETDRGMKNFYKNIYSRIEDLDFKKYIYETIKEWSKPEYVLSKHCQYILKEIEEKEGEKQS